MFKSFFASILSGGEHLFAGLFSSLKSDVVAELGPVETGIITFMKTDLGKLAADAVNEASAKFSSNPEAFAGAKAQFLEDAKIAGHDLETLGRGVVDWMIQTAFIYAARIVAQLVPVA